MSPRAPTRSFEAGEVILGKYRVIRALGVGGYGCVLEAEHLRTTRLVAIKVVDGEALSRSPAAARRLKLEARAAARLSHPNSVAVIDLEEDADGTLYFVQEHLEGETLHARLERERKLPWREALTLMAPVMSALAEAHRKAIVHRDIKPENIFLTKSAPDVLVPKVIDFGVARVFDAGELRLTQQDRVVGTPWYMSPEQAAGERELDGQTDVWAVGVVLYECVAGAPPFGGGNLEALMRAVASGDHTPVRLRCPELPERVAAVIERCLARDRAERFPTMDALLDVTRELLGRPTTDRRAPAVPRVPERASAPPSREVKRDEPRRSASGESAPLRSTRASGHSYGIAIAIAGMGLSALGGFAVGARAGAAVNASTPLVIRAPVAAQLVAASPDAAPLDAAPLPAAQPANAPRQTRVVLPLAPSTTVTPPAQASPTETSPTETSPTPANTAAADSHQRLQRRRRRR